MSWVKLEYTADLSRSASITIKYHRVRHLFNDFLDDESPNKIAQSFERFFEKHTKLTRVMVWQVVPDPASAGIQFCFRADELPETEPGSLPVSCEHIITDKGLDDFDVFQIEDDGVTFTESYEMYDILEKISDEVANE